MHLSEKGLDTPADENKNRILSGFSNFWGELGMSFKTHWTVAQTQSLLELCREELAILHHSASDWRGFNAECRKSLAGVPMGHEELPVVHEIRCRPQSQAVARVCPEKCEAVFRKDARQNKKLEPAFDSFKSG